MTTIAAVIIVLLVLECCHANQPTRGHTTGIRHSAVTADDVTTTPGHFTSGPSSSGLSSSGPSSSGPSSSGPSSSGQSPSGPSASDSPFYWEVTEGNRTCLVISMRVKLVFTYTVTDDVNKTVSYRLPATASGAHSSCGRSKKDPEWLVIDFFRDWRLSLEYKYNTDNDTWHMRSVHVHFNYSDESFPNATSAGGLQTGLLVPRRPFHVISGHVFKCSSEVALTGFTGLPDSIKVSVILSDQLVSAFLPPGASLWGGEGSSCPADTRPTRLMTVVVSAGVPAILVVMAIGYLADQARRRRRLTRYETI